MTAALARTANATTGAGVERRRLLEPGGLGSFGLAGVLHDTPAAAGGAPATYAVLAPGWAGDRCGPGEIFLPMAGALLNISKATATSPAKSPPIGHVVRFDVAGRGEAPGDYGTSDLDAMVDDGLRALAVAAQDAGATPGSPVPVHLIGMCSGGNLALGVAGLWARLQSRDENDLAHLAPEVVVALRAVRLVSVQAISTFPFQEMRPEDLNTIRRSENRRKTLGKLFQAESYKKLLTGKLNPTRILKNWFEAEPGAAKGSSGGSDDGPEPVNRKLSRRDLLAGLVLYARQSPGALQFVYADGDPEGVASIPVYEAFFKEHEAQVKFQTLSGCNHNFYGQPAREKLFPTLCGFIA
ncbi:MAG TPA: hypothetical protein VL860_00905 [Planctomycetota bacterium]|nr:hypothetical protein [Planctomycetota bacterium]